MKSFLSKAGVLDNVPVTESEKSSNTPDKEAGFVTQQQQSPDLDDEDVISEDAQPGIQKIEAITSVWSTSHLTFAYIL